MNRLLGQRLRLLGWIAASFGPCPAFGDHQGIGPAPVGAEDELAQRRLVRGLDQSGGRAVAENGSQRSVAGVDIFRVGFGGNQQHPFCYAAADQTVGQRQSINKARASQVEIQRADRSGQPQAMLHDAGRGGQDVIGRLRAKQKKVDRFAVDVIPGEKPFRRRHAQVRCALVRLGYVTVPHARLGKDRLDIPFGEHRGELIYILYFFRQMNGNGAYRRIRHNLVLLHLLKNLLP